MTLTQVDQPLSFGTLEYAKIFNTEEYCVTIKSKFVRLEKYLYVRTNTFQNGVVELTNLKFLDGC